MAKTSSEKCQTTPTKTGQIFGRKPSPFESPEMTLKGKSRTVPKDFLIDDVLPEVTSTTWRCKRKPPKGSKVKSLRPCHIELAFVGDKISQKQGVPPGAYLRLCMEWAGDAYLIPVSDHQDAMKKSKEICKCHMSKSRKRCAAAFSKKYLEKTAGKIQQEERARKAKVKASKKDCLRWSKDGKRCLRRRPKD